MSYKIVAVFLSALVLGGLIGCAIPHCLVFCAEPHAASPQNETIAEMISKTSESEIYDTVAYLTQTVGPRYYGTAGNSNAGTYLHDRLGNIAGLTVEYQGTYRNVIGTLPGISSRIYIIGAHYDTVRNCPGATDNAGGCAIVLELARIMSQYRFNHTIKFAFWNNEEGGCLGSANYVSYAKTNNLDIAFYFNYDSSCYDPNSKFILDIMYNAQSSWASDLITDYNTLYGIDFTLTYNSHTCGSDHRPFWNNGYTAIMTHSETHGAQYHTPADTIDKISTVYAKKNGQLGMTVIAELAEVSANTTDLPLQVTVFRPIAGRDDCDVSILSNFTLSNFEFNVTQKRLSFDMTGILVSQGEGFCNITLPTRLLEGPYLLMIDGDTILQYYIPPTNGTHVFISFTHAASNHTAEVIGTCVPVPEFSPTLALLILAVATLLSTTISRRKKLSARICVQRSRV